MRNKERKKCEINAFFECEEALKKVNVKNKKVTFISFFTFAFSTFISFQVCGRLKCPDDH